MFCEIMLGQLLGPNPGQGSNYDPAAKGFTQYAHAHTGLPPERVKDFRRYYGWKDALGPNPGQGARTDIGYNFAHAQSVGFTQYPHPGQEAGLKMRWNSDPHADPIGLPPQRGVEQKPHHRPFISQCASVPDRRTGILASCKGVRGEQVPGESFYVNLVYRALTVGTLAISLPACQPATRVSQPL
jgi:hypothetical protein